MAQRWPTHRRAQLGGPEVHDHLLGLGSPTPDSHLNVKEKQRHCHPKAAPQMDHTQQLAFPNGHVMRQDDLHLVSASQQGHLLMLVACHASIPEKLSNQMSNNVRRLPNSQLPGASSDLESFFCAPACGAASHVVDSGDKTSNPNHSGSLACGRKHRACISQLSGLCYLQRIGSLHHR